MKQQQWQQIEHILDRVLSIDNYKEKKEVVKKACKGNQKLYNDVMLLLENIREAEKQGFLNIDS